MDSRIDAAGSALPAAFKLPAESRFGIYDSDEILSLLSNQACFNPVSEVDLCEIIGTKGCKS
jgi:hypothetical protein